MGKGFAKKRKQMRMMQEQFSELQDKFSNTKAVGSSGNGLVTIELNGNFEMVNISIKPDCVDPEDIEGLEDLIKEAYKIAAESLQEQMPNMDNMQQQSMDLF